MDITSPSEGESPSSSLGRRTLIFHSLPLVITRAIELPEFFYDIFKLMIRRWLLWIVTLGFLWIIVSRFTQIEKLAHTIASGRWNWVLAAVLLQIIYFMLLTALYQVSLQTVEVETHFLHLFPLTFSSFFLNFVAPAGGATGNALFIDDAARRGQSPVRAAAGVLLMMITDFLGFTFLLVAGLIILFKQQDLKIYELVASGLLILITISLASLLFMGSWRPSLQKRLLHWVQSLVNRAAGFLKRPELLKKDWAEKTSEEFVGAPAAMNARPMNLVIGLSISVISHLVNVVCIYCLFLAFYHPVKISIPVAGYAIGILFWIISITPQGVGVVEGLMALTFASLNIPLAVATIIAITYRGLNIWLPVIIGFFLIRRVHTFAPSQSTSDNRWSIRLAAILTALMGVINVVSAVSPLLLYRLSRLVRMSPLELQHGSRLTAALAGFALLLLAGNLWRRKRLAWMMTVIILVISAITHILIRFDFEQAGVAAIFAIWLVTLRTDFHARSDPPSIRAGFRVLILAVVFTLVYGSIGFYLQDKQYSVQFDLWQALKQTIVMFTQFYNPGLQPRTDLSRYFISSIYIIGASTIGYALLMVARPVLIRAPALEADRSRARKIIEAYGKTSLARLCLLKDKSYYFSPGGSVIAYITKGRVALSLGDPIGPNLDFSNAVRGFKQFCARNDWIPAFYQVLPEHLEAYSEEGFRAISIGSEAILPLAGFSVEDPAKKHLRDAYNNLQNLGYSTEFKAPPQSRETIQELRSVNDEWLAITRGTERGFSYGWFEDEYIRSSPIMNVCSLNGSVAAFANLLPEYQKNELSIDLICHRAGVPHETIDFLLISTLLWARSQGCSTFSLGFSSMVGVGEDEQDSAAEKGLRFILAHVNQFYNFRGLHEFIEKFEPVWEPRSLVFPGNSSLPVVGLALARADSGDVFVFNYLKNSRV